MFFLRLALLSIFSHRRRSAIIALGVLLSVVVMIFVGAMMGGLRVSFFSDLLRESGHLQIHAAGWAKRLDPYSLDYVLKRPDQMIARIEADPLMAPRLDHAEPLIRFGALLVHGERNVAMEGDGVEPGTRFFARVRSHVTAGSFLPDGRAGGAPSGIAVSVGIARILDLKLGDPVVVLVQDSTGGPYYLSYPLTGIFSSGTPETDDFVFFMSLSDARKLLDLPGQATEIRMTFKDADSAAFASERLSALLSDERPSIETWRDIQGGLIALIRLGDLYTAVINLIVIIVAGTVITSSVLMTIFQRIPTFGTLRAIGLKRRQLFRIILEEGILLGLIGSALGVAVGLPLAIYFEIHGLNVGAVSKALGTGTTYHFALTARSAIADFLAGVLIAACAYLYGALVSVRMRLIESLERGG
ncbi:MAG: FtsX-like permease family protein [Spirochaetia bacterium]